MIYKIDLVLNEMGKKLLNKENYKLTYKTDNKLVYGSNEIQDFIEKEIPKCLVENGSMTVIYETKFDKLVPGDTVQLWHNISKHGRSGSFAEVDMVDNDFVYLKMDCFGDPLLSGNVLKFEKGTGFFVCKIKNYVPYIELCDEKNVNFFREQHERNNKIYEIKGLVEDEKLYELSNDDLDKIISILR